jgi:hypothetical protein
VDKAARDFEPVSGAKNGFPTWCLDEELAFEHGVDLVDIVRVRPEIRARRIHISMCGIAKCIELFGQRLQGEFAV